MTALLSAENIKPNSINLLSPTDRRFRKADIASSRQQVGRSSARLLDVLVP